MCQYNTNTTFVSSDDLSSDSIFGSLYCDTSHSSTCRGPPSSGPLYQGSSNLGTCGTSIGASPSSGSLSHESIFGGLYLDTSPTRHGRGPSGSGGTSVGGTSRGGGASSRNFSTEILSVGVPEQGSGQYALAQLDADLGGDGGGNFNAGNTGTNDSGNHYISYGITELGVTRGDEPTMRHIGVGNYVNPRSIQTTRNSNRMTRTKWREGLVATCRHYTHLNLEETYHTFSPEDKRNVNQIIADWAGTTLSECERVAPKSP